MSKNEDREWYRSEAKFDNVRQRRAAKAEAAKEAGKKVSKKKTKKEENDGE